MPLDPALRAALDAAGAGVAAYTPPATLYLAADTGTVPTDEAVGTELLASTDPGYARAMITPATLMVLVDGNWVNASDIVFSAATSDWSDDVTAVEAFPLSSGQANRQWYYVLASPVTVAAGGALRIPAGELIFTPAS